ncbi:AraC family transcriptional regulator [Hymenobacter sp. H14-R3]|uniref:helix-turn-helix domain-containing protein n=1 Tax=Hymenobacter sp. H14-R3 TaxID=3046308 RepID=UPI0024BAC9CF|nr:AraC family transcriptional regulator [Hymenobacter sp. H14-R3]MDJ0365813.1 AraC family transcriptional regulator [Hymenobacter sp. H14-R3]
MKLYIKYMVSVRCKKAVQDKLDKLDKLGLHYGTVDLGEVVFKQSITPQQHDQLKVELQELGVELLDQHQGKVIEQVKKVIEKMVYHADSLPKIKNSEYISQQLKRDYTYLATLFSEATGVTIEQSIINHKIERVKELLLYDELTLTEIAYKLNYCSVAHLSGQFKKTTGLTPTFFKQMKHKMRHL